MMVVLNGPGMVIFILVSTLLLSQWCTSFSLSSLTMHPFGMPKNSGSNAQKVTAIFAADVEEVTPKSSGGGGSSGSAFPLNTLFGAAARAAVPKPAETESGAHDAFRFEWGRWVDDGYMAELMDQVNKIKIQQGGKVYDRLLSIEKVVPSYIPSAQPDDDNDGKIKDALFTRDKDARRFRVSGGDNWDCILHVLPKGMEWQGRWPTGSWAIVRALTGVVEIAMLRGPDRDGFIKKVTTMKLRGGGDGSLGGGGGGGEDCVKYVGGALRCYSGVSGKTMLLEVVLRPPIGTAGTDGDGRLSLEMEPLPPEDVLMDGIEDMEEDPVEEDIEEVEKPLRELKRERSLEPSKWQDAKGKRQARPLEPPLPETQEPTIPLSEFPRVQDVEFVDDDEIEFVDGDDVYEDDVYEDDFDDEGFYDDEEYLENDRISRVAPEDTIDSKDQQPTSLGKKMGLSFDRVGGLDEQLDAIVRRVLASRANPEAARRLGVKHVRGILLSGPPGCGKTLLARELSEMLGAREPQIVNGPEILDKFIGEAEKNVRALFEPAELEYEQLGDESALHVIILDELDAIARRRGSVSGDTTGVRDSVVNQLLAKMDGVKEANNVLVIGLTNRPELLDPALVRPGRLEVQLRVDLPDRKGRRDILRIHTARMREAGGLSWEAQEALQDIASDDGIPARTEYFSGAEIAGLVRSAASFALARTVEEEYTYGNVEEEATVLVSDFERALSEVRPALGKQDEILEARFPHGISPCSPSIQRVIRDLERFTSTPNLLAKQRSSASNGKSSPTLQSLLLVGDGYKGGTGVSALACWAASQASAKGEANYVRLITSLDLLAFGGGSGDESGRAAALVERFTEAYSMSNSLLVFDDIDQVCAGSGPDGYSSLMLSTLRALLRFPAAGASSLPASGLDLNSDIAEREVKAKSLSVLAATSRTDSVCNVLHELFDETLVVPELSDTKSVEKLMLDSIQQMGGSASADIIDSTISSMAELMINRLETVGCKTCLMLLQRAIAVSYRAKDDGALSDKDFNNFVIKSLTNILDDYQSDQAAAARISCVLR